MRVIFVIFIFFASVFAVDATMVVSNEALSLPKLKIVDKTGNINQGLKSNFNMVLKSDFKVSAAYEVIENDIYDFVFEYNLLQNQSTLTINGTLKDKSGKQIYNKSLSSNDISDYVFLSHNYIADFAKDMNFDDLSWMRQKIIFAKKISAKRSSIVIADYTLKYQKTIISSGLNLFPKWADNAQSSFYYSDYSNKNIVLYKYDMLTGKKSQILSGNGMLVVTDVSKDGNKFLVTMAPNDQPDIYVYDMTSKNLKRVTDYKGIDVSGKFIKNDNAVVFVSDRLGYPNVFMQNIGSSSVTQMVYQGKNNSSISTYDNYIVYSSREDSATFNLYLMSLDSEYVRQLTANGKNIFPKFSQNGNSILFIKLLGGQSSIAVLRINQNLAFNFALRDGLIHSLDW